jgi:hypothetical protein
MFRILLGKIRKFLFVDFVVPKEFVFSAWDEGTRAYSNAYDSGEKRNPYEPGSARYRSWELGFHDAERNDMRII